MARFSKTKKTLILAIFLLAAFFSYKMLAYFFGGAARADSLDFSNSQKQISISDNNFYFIVETQANTVGDVLKEKNINLKNQDKIVPEKNSPIYPGITIKIDRAVKIKIQVDGQTIENYSAEKTVGGALSENNVALGRLDKVLPEVNSRPQANSVIAVTRINVEEKTVTEDIDFKTTTKEDPKLGWREQKIQQAGQKGQKEVKYRITYKNNKEISRIILETKVTQDPINQIAIQGTFMQLGKADKGQGTWYAFKGGLFAASTSLPRGSYARVTNLANGKSVIVQINDYGPQGKGRIIDLDKVAFTKIASLGAGIIGVKVEAVLN